MAKSNLLTIPVSKLEPLVKFNWLPANLQILISAAIILTTGVVAIQKFQAEKVPENKSLAWYMANPKEALAKNQECYDNPQLKTTENCVNSLHALEVMHKGPNS